MKAQKLSTGIAVLMNMVDFMPTFIVHSVLCDTSYRQMCLLVCIISFECVL
jgi:hypothetical protein